MFNALAGLNLGTLTPVKLADSGLRVEIQIRRKKTKKGTQIHRYWNYRWQSDERDPETGKKKRGYRYGGTLDSLPDKKRLDRYVEQPDGKE